MAKIPTIALIIPTVGRPTLARTLESLRSQQWREGDQVVVVGDGFQPTAKELFEQFNYPFAKYVELPNGPYKDWGHTPRNMVMPTCTQDYIMALDDDDIMDEEAIRIVRNRLIFIPNRPHLFKMRGHPDAYSEIWTDEEVREGNVGTPMFVIPNVPEKIAKYTNRYGGYFDFIRDTCALHPGGPVWNDEVICKIRPCRHLE